MSAASANGKTTQEPDLEVILPEAGIVTVPDPDGEPIRCTVRRCKTREILMIVRILTGAFGDGLARLDIDTRDQQAMVTKIVGVMMVAIPDQIDDFLVLVNHVVEPTDADTKTRNRLKGLLANPELDVMLEVVEVLATQEAPDLKSLLGKAQAMWKRLQPVFQTGGTDDHSPEPSTS